MTEGCYHQPILKGRCGRFRIPRTYRVTEASPAVNFVSEKTTRELLTPKACLEVVERCFRWQAEGKVSLPSPPVWRLREGPMGAYYHVKGCILTEIPVFGVRIVGYRVREDGTGTADKDNTRLILLQDPLTSRPLALVDEHWNYALRTTASAIVGVKYLSNPGSNSVGLVGVGSMGYASLLQLSELLDIQEVRVTSRRPESRESFAERMRAELNLNVCPVDTVEAAIGDADIAVVCTTAKRNLVFPGYIKKGATVVSLSSFDIAEGVYGEFDKIVVDDWEGLKHVADIKGLVTKGVLTDNSIHGQLSDIVTHRKAGREDADERILIRTEGLVSQDVAVAHWVYEQALQAGLATPIG